MNRLKYTCWALFTGALVAGILFFIWMYVSEVRTILKDGTKAQGTVLSVERVRQRKVSVQRHIIAYDGQQRRFDLDSAIPVGRKVSIVYLPNDPDKAIVSEKPVSLWGGLTEDGYGNVVFIVFLLGLALLLTFSTLFSIKCVIYNTSEES